MPIFDFLHWDSKTGDTLSDSGPLIQVVINVPSALEEFLVQKQLVVPNPVPGYALIDTGASASAVHEPVLQQLSILPIDSIPTSTPSGPGRSFVYPTRVSFPGIFLQDYRMDRVIGSDLNWKTSDGKEIIMLLGRDLLKYFLLVYNGRGSTITLAY